MTFSPTTLTTASRFAAACLLGLALSACGGSTGDRSDEPEVPVEDPPVTPPDDTSVAPKAGVYDSIVVEGADDLEFVVSLSAAASASVSIEYTTVDGSAIAGEDYSAKAGTLTFSPGEVRKFISVGVLDNASVQSDSSKTLKLVLSKPLGSELVVDTAKGTIIDRHFTQTDDLFDENWGPVGVFTDAQSCAFCHQSDGAIMQYDGKDISPPSQWQHSVMAHSFNDPYWQAAVEEEVGNFPHLADFIEDTCVTCHAPMGRTHAKHQDASQDYLFDTARSENIAREGVSCTTCHQIQEGSTDSGGYVISDSERIIFGPYADPLVGPMFNNSGYTPQHAQHVQTSEMCASCHTLYTPAIDPATGAPSGPDTGLPSAVNGFLEQGPFLEWQNSVYATGQASAAQCQDCHMPVPSDSYSTRISTRPMMGHVLSPREPFSQHTLLGGNAHLLEILRDYRSELGIDGSTSEQGFDDQIALTRGFLEDAATLSISAPALVGDLLQFDVEVVNRAGHKIPSAYPSRRSWLHVTVKDNVDSVVFESGKPDARGYLSTDKARLRADCMAGDKLDGFDSSLCFEPHRDVIDDPSQVAIYETVLGDVNGTITHTLLYAAQYLKDNRIPPAGFTNDKAETIETQTLPVGVADDGDFNCSASAAAEGCGADTVHYSVDAEGYAGPFTVEARLLYQATQPGFVDGMHHSGDLVNRFKVMYDSVPPSVEVLASAAK